MKLKLFALWISLAGIAHAQTANVTSPASNCSYFAAIQRADLAADRRGSIAIPFAAEDFSHAGGRLSFSAQPSDDQYVAGDEYRSLSPYGDELRVYISQGRGEARRRLHGTLRLSQMTVDQIARYLLDADIPGRGICIDEVVLQDGYLIGTNVLGNVIVQVKGVPMVIIGETLPLAQRNQEAR